MTLDKYVAQTFLVKCRGNTLDNNGDNPPLDEPVDAKVYIYQRKGNDKNIQSTVECPHNRGGHGEYCIAGLIYSKIKQKIKCPYNIFI